MKTCVIEGKNVGLTAKYGEYNCGNKTVGRLELLVTELGSKTNLGGGIIAHELAKEKIRDKIIENYLADLLRADTFIPLKDGAPFFPTDSGKYPPGVLIYADNIRMNKAFTWWNNWKGLIEVFENEPKFGVVVLKSPILPNKYYGTGAPSRVWTLVLPSISEHICYDKQRTTKEMLAALTSIKLSYGSPHLNKELASLGVK